MMMRSRSLFFVVGACLSSLSTSACVVENDPPHQYGPGNAYAPASSGGVTGGVATGTGSGATDATTPGSPSPMLVEVDTDQTMNAVGGDGVGVFIEYAKDGHWHVWWTCDTNQTQKSCAFTVSATAASGDLTNIDATELAGGFIASPSTSRVDATSTTTTQVSGIRFDATAGGIVTIEASVGGLKDGAFLFFVQDGKVNGGFTGTLTDPLQVQGSAP